MTRHGYHVVQLSPWPIIVSIAAFSIAWGIVRWVHGGGILFLCLGLLLLVSSLFSWWMDVIVEATYLGRHTSLVYKGLRVGMLMFILSEAMFFFSFFWSYIYYANVMGHLWPPEGISPLWPYGVPLFNTVVLVGSGFTLTWSQRCLSAGSRGGSMVGLFFTILLGVLFSCAQFYEFYDASFTFADTVYGSVFYLATGFHGLHVIIGTIFLIVNFFRMWRHHYSPSHHFGFTSACWYWHFVDVIWILLYMLIYCSGWEKYISSLMYY